MRTIMLTRGEYADYEVLGLFSCEDNFDIKESYENYRKHINKLLKEIKQKRDLHLPGCQTLSTPTLVEYLTELQLITPFSYEQIDLNEIRDSLETRVEPDGE